MIMIFTSISPFLLHCRYAQFANQKIINFDSIDSRELAVTHLKIACESFLRILKTYIKALNDHQCERKLETKENI